MGQYNGISPGTTVWPHTALKHNKMLLLKGSWTHSKREMLKQLENSPLNSSLPFPICRPLSLLSELVLLFSGYSKASFPHVAYAFLFSPLFSFSVYWCAFCILVAGMKQEQLQKARPYFSLLPTVVGQSRQQEFRASDPSIYKKQEAGAWEEHFLVFLRNQIQCPAPTSLTTSCNSTSRRLAISSDCPNTKKIRGVCSYTWAKHWYIQNKNKV